MKRIYAFAIGLAILAVPAAAAPVVASAEPGARSMDYQQATDVVIARGLSQRGVPFSWAGGGINGPTRGTGTGINTVGFDASGLMQYAYAGAGIKLPRSSGAMYKVGQKVLPQQARKGDLIFYGPEGTQSVAMYLGNNQMLEVGDVVQVSPVRANGMAPYLVRVLGVQSAPVQPLPQQAPLQSPRSSNCPPSRPRRSRCPPRRHRSSRRRCSSSPLRPRCLRRRCSNVRFSRHRCSNVRCSRHRSSRLHCSRPRCSNCRRSKRRRNRPRCSWCRPSNLRSCPRRPAPPGKPRRLAGPAHTAACS
ncbi:NlpC/P60 family protein [Mycobacterium europaeum]|uniref:NlpC/P60 family protein n=1 Tax=Mycobacterium europaeum TaxID=761804 RepID=A0A0U1DES1_9MYCO|nr:NlpC/P60 family protein [Mycobacterium europaeum]